MLGLVDDDVIGILVDDRAPGVDRLVARLADRLDRRDLGPVWMAATMILGRSGPDSLAEALGALRYLRVRPAGAIRLTDGTIRPGTAA